MVLLVSIFILENKRGKGRRNKYYRHWRQISNVCTHIYRCLCKSIKAIILLNLLRTIGWKWIINKQVNVCLHWLIGENCLKGIKVIIKIMLILTSLGKYFAVMILSISYSSGSTSYRCNIFLLSFGRLSPESNNL